METSLPGIFAAGDIARWPDRLTGEHFRQPLAVPCAGGRFAARRQGRILQVEVPCEMHEQRLHVARIELARVEGHRARQVRRADDPDAVLDGLLAGLRQLAVAAGLGGEIDFRVLHKQIEVAFMSNPGLNALIIGVLLVGIVYAYLPLMVFPIYVGLEKLDKRLLEASADDLEWTPGRFSVRGDPDKGVTIAEIALATFFAHNTPEGVEPSIDAEATYDPDNFSFPHGTHLCAMEVDTETGQLTMRTLAAVEPQNVIDHAIEAFGIVMDDCQQPRHGVVDSSAELQNYPACARREVIESR